MPIRRIFLIISAALLLTACTPLIDASSPTSPTSAPSAVEEPETQAFELGEFDSEGDFELFDPCTEIPGDLVADAGFSEGLVDPSYDRDVSVFCMFPSSDPQSHGILTLTGDKNPTEKIIERGFMISQDLDSEVPGAYLHHLGGSFSDYCSAAVETTRGRFVADYSESQTERNREDLCAVALEKLEFFYNNLGENNGNIY